MGKSEYEEIVNDILNDSSISYFVKESIEKLSNRDVVDVINDLELLHMLFNLKLNDILEINNCLITNYE